MPRRHDLVGNRALVIGGSRTIELLVVDEEDNFPRDITGALIEIDVRENNEDETRLFRLSTTDASQVLVDPDQVVNKGKVKIFFRPAQTSLVLGDDILKWDARLTLGADIQHIVSPASNIEFKLPTTRD
jgi:hypothetical protein